MKLKDNIAESLEIETGSVTRSFTFVLGTMLFYMLALGVDVLPGSLGLTVAAGFLIFWLGYPVALHYDRIYVAANSDWKPSKWYYLGFLPGYLGIAFVAYYIYRRREVFSVEPVE